MRSSVVDAMSTQNLKTCSIPWLILVIAVMAGTLLACAPGEGRPDADADVQDDADAQDDASYECEDVNCGHGTCVILSPGVASCACDQGYHPEGLQCLPDDPCEGVNCGANAFCDLGLCHCDDGYEGNPYDGCTWIPTVEDTCRAGLVDIAAAELGFCEGVDDRPYMHAQPGLWCYDFVAWVYSQSACYPPTPLYLPRRTVGALPEGWRPAAGDLIKFTIQHYGMVASVSGNGQVITTIEGNVNSCVMSRTIVDGDVEYYGTLEDVW